MVMRSLEDFFAIIGCSTSDAKRATRTARHGTAGAFAAGRRESSPRPCGDDYSNFLIAGARDCLFFQ
jgi:hypothetical protein